MRRCTCLAALVFFLFTALAATAPAAGPPDSKPLSFLFLGDRGLHHPADRYAQIAPVLAGRKIEVTCTENLSDLNPATLGKYDALLNFANATRIGKDQEKALLDHVAGGGGFVPLHCASFCFLNSPEESQKHLALPAGLEARLFVAEPQIFKPITMTWDHLGRLYLAETVDYPNEMQPRGKGRDRISIVEDTDGDGDGEADRVSLFADNLSIPMSLCTANGGLIIAQTPGMLSGLEAGVQARQSAGPVSDRHTREEGRDRQHRGGERQRPDRADRPGRDRRGLRMRVPSIPIHSIPFGTRLRRAEAASLAEVRFAQVGRFTDEAPVACRPALPRPGAPGTGPGIEAG